MPKPRIQKGLNRPLPPGDGPFAALSTLFQQQERLNLDEIDPLTAQLGALARHATTSESLLQQAVLLVCTVTKSTSVTLYLCGTSSVAVAKSSTSEIRFVREAILFCATTTDKQILPDRVEFENTSSLRQVLHSRCGTALRSGSVKNLAVVPFFQGLEVRGALVLMDGNIKGDDEFQAIAHSFSEFCVMLELVTDRYLQKDLVDLNAQYLSFLSEHPQLCMSHVLRIASGMVGCEGMSFFARDPYDDRGGYSLVGTFPRPLPVEKPMYALGDGSLTSKIVENEKDCVVHYTDFERVQLSHFSEPRWRDTLDGNKSRTVLYVMVSQGDEIVALLRCTNRINHAQSSWFNWIDVRRAKAIASALLPFYKAAQKEDRFASSLSDISHEIKTMAGGIRYTAQNIRDQLCKVTLPSGVNIDDVILKLGHIERSSNALRKLLPALRQEAAADGADRSVLQRISRGFKPYADLCKPIAEMYIQQARARRITIEHFGSDQLGLIYGDIEDFRHIVENLISNAVKYSLPGREIKIYYRRPEIKHNFAAIHVISESLKVLPEEEEFIFKFRQRAQSARSSQIEGEGIGLAIARAKARQHGGDVIFRARNELNVFSLLIQRSLFQSPVILNAAP